MKIIKIIILGLLIPFSVYPQSRFSISLSASPVLSNSALQTDKESDAIGGVTYKDMINDINDRDKYSPGFKIHLGINYYLNEKLSFNSGLNYLKQDLSQSNLDPPFSFNYETNTINHSYGTSKISLNYISLPLGLCWDFVSKNKFLMGFNFGISEDYLMNKKTLNESSLTYTQNEVSAEGIIIDSYMRYASEVNLGLTMKFKVNQNTIFFTQPNFNYFFTPNLTRYIYINQNNYYFGIEFGFQYTMNGH